MLANGLRQARQGFLVKMLSGLVQAGFNLGDRDGHRAAGLVLEGGVPPQGVQPFS